jgi:hypothetical protein
LRQLGVALAVHFGAGHEEEIFGREAWTQLAELGRRARIAASRRRLGGQTCACACKAHAAAALAGVEVDEDPRQPSAQIGSAAEPSAET